MNKVILVGRLTKDPETKTTQSQIEYCSFSIAVDRKFKNANGEKQSDFINCTAWRNQAKLLGQYFSKGSRIGIVGSLQTRTYDDKDGKKVYVTEVAVDEIEFIDSKKDGEHGEPRPAVSSAASEAAGGFYPTASDDDPTGLPFDL